MGVGCTVVASVLVLNAVAVGSAVGEVDGEAVGVAVGSTEGEVDGEAVGVAVSAVVGCFVVESVLEGNDKENEYE